MKKLVLALSLIAVTAPVATPALADPPRHAPAHGWRDKHEGRHYDRRDYDRRDYRSYYNNPHRYNAYDRRGYYVVPQRIGYNDRIWYDRGRYYCRRNNGTTGLIIGAGVGALAGSELAGRGDRTVGAILGGVAGGLIGREIDRGSLQCR